MTGNVSALFRATFGEAPRVVASAPGRVNLIGEHTDYNGGPVLPLATPARTSVAVGPAQDGVLELISTLDGEPARIDWRDGRPAGWTAYVAGVMRELDTAGAAPRGAVARLRLELPELVWLASWPARWLPRLKRALTEPLRSRALHVVGETARTRLGAQLLTRGHMRRFGELLYEAHESCRRLYECSAPELDLVVAAARRAGALGARLTGAGWGGAVLVLLGKRDGGKGTGEAKVAKEIRRAFTAAYGREPSITRVRPSGGARGKPVTARGARA